MMKIHDIKLILLFQLIYQLQNIRSSSEDSMPETDESQELNEPALEEDRHSHKHSLFHRTGHHHKRSRYRHYYDHDHVRARASNNYNDDCDCSCNKCDSPSNCCRIVCQSCPSSNSNPYQQPQGTPGMSSQSNVMFVPYPFPMMMPSPIIGIGVNHETTLKVPTNNTTATSTTATCTTATCTTATCTTATCTTATSTTTTTNCPPDLLLFEDNKKINILESMLKSAVNDNSNKITKTPEKLKSGENNYVLTSLRRTKPAWMPKFGIVPISDNIAQKLILKLSRSRAPLHSQKRVPNK